MIKCTFTGNVNNTAVKILCVPEYLCLVPIITKWSTVAVKIAVVSTYYGQH